jgi:hypothetical protein
MNWKKFGLTTIVAFVVMFLLGWLMHGIVLKGDYMAMEKYNPMFFRTEAAAMERMWVMAVGYLVFAAGLAWIYAQGVSRAPWAGQAIRFSLAIAAVAIVPGYLINYTVLLWPYMVVVKQICADVIAILITGLVIGAIYRSEAAGKSMAASGR